MSFAEKDFQKEFNKWVKYKYEGSGAFELKICKGKSLPFNAVKDHQIDNLRIAKHSDKGLVYKIPDDSIGVKPFDSFKLVCVPSFVVIMFYKRGQKEFIMIDVDKYVEEVNNSERKSLTEDRAKEIGIVCQLN